MLYQVIKINDYKFHLTCRREIPENPTLYTTLKSSTFRRVLFAVRVFEPASSSEEKCYLVWENQHRKIDIQENKMEIYLSSCKEVRITKR